jgi:hypothetical protein
MAFAPALLNAIAAATSAISSVRPDGGRACFAGIRPRNSEPALANIVLSRL